jgi:hypothetical protein
MDTLLLNARTVHQPPTSAQKISKQNACYLLANRTLSLWYSRQPTGTPKISKQNACYLLAN